MQTYIFLFTPRIRLDCTNEIKNWISCEEKKKEKLLGRAQALDRRGDRSSRRTTRSPRWERSQSRARGDRAEG